MNDTPGPTDYNVKTSLLDENKNKHYGFIEKSKRFQSENIANDQIIENDENRGVLKGINENTLKILKKNDEKVIKQKA